MPGVTTKNYHSVLKKFDNILAVSKASLEELTAVLGNSVQAQQLYNFFHKKCDFSDTSGKRSPKPAKHSGYFTYVSQDRVDLWTPCRHLQ